MKFIFILDTIVKSSKLITEGLVAAPNMESLFPLVFHFAQEWVSFFRFFTRLCFTHARINTH